MDVLIVESAFGQIQSVQLVVALRVRTTESADTQAFERSKKCTYFDGLIECTK